MGQQRFATTRGLLEDREEERKGPTGSPSRDGDSYPGAKYVFIGSFTGKSPAESCGEGPLVSIWIIARAVGLGVDSSPTWRFAREVAALCRLE